MLLEPTTLAGALQQPELRDLGQLYGGRLPAGGLRHDPERLRLEHLHADGKTLLLRLPRAAECRRAAWSTSLGTVSAPQLFASNTLIVTNTSDFLESLPDEELGGLEQAADFHNSAASDSGPELQLLGNQSFLERDGRTSQAHHINDEALVQTKSLSTQLFLPRTRGTQLPCDRGQHGNTSFTNLSDSRVKTVKELISE